MPIICKESCRLSNPEDLVGDYVRGQYYHNPRLIVYYPGLFDVIEMFFEPASAPEVQESSDPELDSSQPVTPKGKKK